MKCKWAMGCVEAEGRSNHADLADGSVVKQRLIAAVPTRDAELRAEFVCLLPRTTASLSQIAGRRFRQALGERPGNPADTDNVPLENAGHDLQPFPGTYDRRLPSRPDRQTPIRSPQSGRRR